MFQQNEIISMPTGLWMKYDTFTKEITVNTDYTLSQATIKLNKLIEKQKIVLLHIEGADYIHVDSMDEFLN